MQTRSEWIHERSKIIGASDVGAILGENPFRTNIDVWMDKTGRGKFDADADHLKFGRDVEGAIAGLYETRTTRPVRDLGATVVQIHPDIKWLGATLDRVTDIEDTEGDMTEAPLELKHVGGMFVKKDDWTDDPPSMYQIQVQIQCACFESKYGSLAGMFPGYQLGWVDIEYSKDFFETIHPVLDEFWNHNVKKDICPELIEHDRNLDSMKSLYASENGATVVLDSVAMQLVAEWEQLKSNSTAAAKQAKKIEAQLRALVGESTFASLPDGRFMTLKTTERKGYTVQPTSYRTLRTTKRLK